MCAMRSLLLILFAGCFFHVNAQLNIDFNPHRNGNFGFYSSTTKVKEWDSLSFHISAGDWQSWKFKYLGEFKGNVMDGQGELRVDQVTIGGFIYYGSFKDGRPHGFGHFVKYPRSAFLNLLADGRRSANEKPLYEFKGTFEEGKPKQGLFIGSIMNDGTPAIYYSGEVAYNGENIIWHGFGSLLRIGTDVYGKADVIDNLGRKGGYYEGQFYNSAATGFALSNTITESNELNNLTTMLVGADMVIRTFDQFPLRADHLVEDNILPEPVTGSALLKLLPDLGKATLSTFIIDSSASYKGTVVNGLPYGLGYVEYSDRFRDVGFWSGGKKISPKAVLAALLPDATVLEPKLMEEKMAVKIPKKKKPEEFDIEQKKVPVVYYAAFNAKGKPEGWGWKVNTTYATSEPLIMKFGSNGKDDMLNGDSIYAQTSIEEANPYYYHHDKVLRAQTENLKRSPYRVVKGLKSLKNGLPFLKLQQLGLYDDRFRRVAHIAYIKGMEEAYKKEAEAYARIPTVKMSKIVLYRSNNAKSHVVANGKEIYGKPVNASELLKYDFLFLGGQLKMVSQVFNDYILFSDNSSLQKNAGTVYVIRNLMLRQNVEKLDCKVCNNRPVTTSSTAVNVVTGHKTSTYNTGPNTVNVISTPILTQVGSVSSNSYCKACNGKAGMHINQTVTEIRD